MQRLLRRFLAIASFAASTVSLAAPCPVGTLASYIGLGSCEIGTTLFTNFTTLPTLPAGATLIMPSSISVNPFGSATAVGLTFGLNVTAVDDDLLSSLFGFRVLSGGPLNLTGVTELLVASATGEGTSIFISDLCRGGLFSTPPTGCMGTSGSLLTLATEFFSDTSESVAFGGVALIDVVANFIADGGDAGSATITSGTLQFARTAAVVPEPGSLALSLFAFALVAAITFATHRKSHPKPSSIRSK